MRKVKSVEVDADAEKKMEQLVPILKSMRDKIQAGDEFPLQKELRRMADNALTLAGCGEQEIEMTESEYAVIKKQVAEFEKKQKSKTTKTQESSKDVKGAAMKAAHSTFKSLAEQHPEAADLLNAHADMYKDEPAEKKDGGNGDDEEAAVGDEATPDTTESEKKESKKEKMEREKKEKMESDKEDMESDKEEKETKESLRKELFSVKLENKLSESALPAPICKMIRNLSEGKTLEQVDEMIEAQSEVLELTLRESRGASMPERTFAGSGKINSGKPALADDPAFK